MNDDKNQLLTHGAQENEIIVYQPDETLKLDVRLENETVWLNRNQIAILFDRDVKTIGKHINNALREELEGIPTVANFATVQKEGNRMVTRMVEHYSLDMILSVGYRVKSQRGVQFRIWANKILKEYLLRGYSVNQRLLNLEERMDRRFSIHDQQIGKLREDVDFFIKTSLPPKEGIFFNGQIFDAYTLMADLIRSAKSRIVLIDNYVDDSVLKQLDKRMDGVEATVYTFVNRTLRQDVETHNRQYGPINLVDYRKAHDRFLIIDEDVYHIGASLKDLGRKLFAFSKMDVLTGSELISQL